MDHATLLDQPRLSIITRRADYELARIQDLFAHKVLVDGRSDLEDALGGLLVAAEARNEQPAAKTLDLIGHSTPGTSLLVLGDWVIDASKPTVVSFFRGLAELDVMARLGVTAVRLIACETAETGEGRATITRLSDILGIEVYGTRSLIYAAHCDAGGLTDDCAHVLVAASELRSDGAEAGSAQRTGEPYERVLDLDSLPADPLDGHAPPPWPRRLATIETAREILRLVRRSGGTRLPGLLATPLCEVALPATRPHAYHLAQVLLGGELLRVYPDGQDAPGVVYPVEDPPALRALVETLPAA